MTRHGHSEYAVVGVWLLPFTGPLPIHLNFKVEAYLYWPQQELYEFCKKNGITVTAYGPLGSPGRKVFNAGMTWPEAEPMKDPLVLELAGKYNKTPAQVSF